MKTTLVIVLIAAAIAMVTSIELQETPETEEQAPILERDLITNRPEELVIPSNVPITVEILTLGEAIVVATLAGVINFLI
ncbi:hypothetical protein NQ317_006389 [Molorchus minor]|uniref:Uncharacterized protein n=1 Tax=Molorchus minor TaxID=1323400 RepID=A0ABQ9J4B7_9CUCU|nr:hypothetical protein NQ317_006389 [Molorchus minor]